MAVRAFIIFLGLFLAGTSFLYAAPTAVIRGGTVIRNGVIAPVVTDPCQGVAVGDPCPNGVLYAGTGFAGLGSYKYMTTPGHCSDFPDNATPFTPTCTGAADILTKAYGGVGTETGANSETDGAANTTNLAANYAFANPAKYCENMIYPAGGYTDWYFPALEEVYLVLYGMHMSGKGNFVADGTGYGSSTESGPNNFRPVDFNTGEKAYAGKGYVPYLRCVRKY